MADRGGPVTDRDDIIETLGRVAAAIDARDWDTIRAPFTTDTNAYGAAASTAWSPSSRRSSAASARRSTCSATTG
jgi:hypothetical protein